MASKQTDPSLHWYLCGREDIVKGRIEFTEIDLGPILEKIKTPDDVAKLCAEAARNSLSSQSSSSVKREWLDEEFDDAPGAEGESAWAFYLRGQIDELSAMVSDEAIELLCEQLDRDGDEGSEDEPDEDGDADEDDEEGSDGEDDDDEDGEDELDDEP